MAFKFSMSHFVHAGSLVVLGAAPVFAGHADQLIDGKFNATSRKARLEIAADLRQRTTDLLSYISIPTPNAVDWVLSEQREIEKIQNTQAQSERQEKLYDSPDFQQVKLRAELLEIIHALNEIMKQNISTRVEMAYWCRVSLGLTNNESMNDAIRILIQSGRLPSDLPNKVKLGGAIGYTGVLGWWGRGIQEYLIIPYLEGKLRK